MTGSGIGIAVVNAAIAAIPASGGPVSTPVVIGANQSDPAAVTGFTALHPELMTATTDAQGVLTLTSIGGAGDTHANDTGPAYRRQVADVIEYGMVWRMGVTSATGTSLCGADGGLWPVAGGACLASFRLMNDAGGEHLRAVQGAGYVGADIVLGAGGAAARPWFAIQIVGTMLRFWYCLTVSSSEPTAGWVCLTSIVLADAPGAGWVERLDVLRVTSDTSPIGVFSNVRTIRDNVFGWAQ